MSDKDLPFILLRIFTAIFAIFSFCSLCVNSTNIASTTEFPSDCLDGNNVTRKHLETWTSYAGACDRRVCYEGLLKTIKWQINYECPPESYLTDTDTCGLESNSSLPFPECCPHVVCANTSVVTTWAICYDRALTSACELWQQETNCSDSSNSAIKALYNLTVENCKRTCRFCNVTG